MWRKGGMHGKGGHAWWEACMAKGGMHGGGHACQGVCVVRKHAWQGACMAGGACMGGHAWHEACGRGVCVVGGMCGRGVCVAEGFVWQREHASHGGHARYQGHVWDGGRAWQERWSLQGAVRMLLECILVQ